MLILTLCCGLALTACGKAEATAGTLAMNKRYIRESDVKEDSSKQISYVFYSNGTGKYTYHYDYESIFNPEHSHYVITFQYTYADNDKSAVVCFYDSFEALEGNTTEALTDWSTLVTVSKNVLATTGSYGYTFWINEDYLKNIPNFGRVNN